MACRVHSEYIILIKQDTTNRSGSSIIGDIVEKFLMSMKLESTKESPNMDNYYKCPKAGRPVLAKENITPSAICTVFDDPRWEKYVKEPFNTNTQKEVKKLLAINEFEPPFYIYYTRLSKQPGHLKNLRKECRV